MIKNPLRLVPVIVVGLSLGAAVLRCSLTAFDEGNSTQTGNPLITGMLYNPDGSGAKNARVTVVPADYNPQTGAVSGPAVDSTLTGNDGAYRFDSLPAGTYNILGSGVTGRSFRDSFVVRKSLPEAVPNDTLKAPGSLSGVVRLRPGDDGRTVFIIVMGTTTLTAPDDSIGNFTLAGMAGGVYRVRVLSTLDSYRPMDTIFTIKSGKNLALSDTIWLKYTGIPVPAGFTVSYDTMMRKVTLSWNRPSSGRAIKGYNVYRRNVDSNAAPAVLNTQLLADTLYIDSTGVQDMTYEYQAAAVDSQGTEGVKSAGLRVTLTGPYKPVATYGKGTGSGPGYFSELYAIALDDSGNLFCIDKGNNTVRKFDGSGNEVLQWGTTGSDDGQFNRPFGIAIDSERNVYVADRDNDRIQKFNNRGAFIAKWGSPGTGPGQFDQPVRVCNNRGFIYVGECNGKRVQKFDYNGKVLASIAVGGAVTGLAADDATVLVTSDARSIVRYSIDGNFMDTVFIAGKCFGPATNCEITDLFIHPNQKSVFFIYLSEDAFWALDSNNRVYLKQSVKDDLGSVEDLLIRDNFIVVARFNGYIQKYIRR